MKSKKVLIICTGNSCRSQMAEGIINHHLSDTWQAFSAGVNPSHVNPRAIIVMKEIGIDISNQSSKSVDDFVDRDDLDLVITVCDNAKETCPVFPGDVKTIHMGFEDPAEYDDQPNDVALPVFRRVRDEIRHKIVTILDNYTK